MTPGLRGMPLGNGETNYRGGKGLKMKSTLSNFQLSKIKVQMRTESSYRRSFSEQARSQDCKFGEGQLQCLGADIFRVLL